VIGCDSRHNDRQCGARIFESMARTFLSADCVVAIRAPVPTEYLLLREHGSGGEQVGGVHGEIAHDSKENDCEAQGPDEPSGEKHAWKIPTTEKENDTRHPGVSQKRKGKKGEWIESERRAKISVQKLV
jgi:hypothetical protein